MEEDEVVAEFDVQLNPLDDTQIHLLQYPLRPRFRPYGDEGQLSAVRLQPGLLALDFSLTQPSPNYRSDAHNTPQIHTLLGTEVPMRTNYCVGVVKGGVLHLSQIHGTYQLRPEFRHLDTKVPVELRTEVQAKVGRKRPAPRKPTISDSCWEDLPFSPPTDPGADAVLEQLTPSLGALDLDPDLSSEDYIDMLLPQQNPALLAEIGRKKRAGEDNGEGEEVKGEEGKKTGKKKQGKRAK